MKLRGSTSRHHAALVLGQSPTVLGSVTASTGIRLQLHIAS